MGQNKNWDKIKETHIKILLQLIKTLDYPTSLQIIF